MPKKEEKTIVGDKKFHDYELVYILNPELAEDALENRINNISQYITAREGVVSDVQKWGKKRLAYPIKHFLEGYYVLAKFQSKPSKTKELEANLRITEEVLRHLLIKAGA